MENKNFECVQCGIIANFDKQQMKDHMRFHRIENEAIENTQGLIRKELLLD